MAMPTLATTPKARVVVIEDEGLIAAVLDRINDAVVLTDSEDKLTFFEGLAEDLLGSPRPIPIGSSLSPRQ